MPLYDSKSRQYCKFLLADRKHKRSSRCKIVEHTIWQKIAAARRQSPSRRQNRKRIHILDGSNGNKFTVDTGATVHCINDRGHLKDKHSRGSAPLTLSTSAPTRLGCSRCLRGVLEGVPLRNHGVSDAVACSRETGRLLVNGSPIREAKRHSICPPCSGDMHMQHAARSSALPHTHSLMLPLLVRSVR